MKKTEPFLVGNEVDTDIISSIDATYYWQTMNLRYAKRQIIIDDNTVKEELLLQQMWQGDDGTQKWEWVEIFDNGSDS